MTKLSSEQELESYVIDQYRELSIEGAKQLASFIHSQKLAAEQEARIDENMQAIHRIAKASSVGLGYANSKFFSSRIEELESQKVEEKA